MKTVQLPHRVVRPDIFDSVTSVWEVLHNQNRNQNSWVTMLRHFALPAYVGTESREAYEKAKKFSLFPQFLFIENAYRESTDPVDLLSI